MLKDFGQQQLFTLWSNIKKLWHNFFGKIFLLVAVVSLLQALRIWEYILSSIGIQINTLYSFLLNPFWGVPVYFWIITLGLVFWIFWQHAYLRLVSGVFTDNFNNGLSKWEFGGEGWKIEHENKKPYLSVSQSSDGGITKKGFAWSDYEFSFKTKMVKKNAGWIIRAEHRNKYLMIQLNMEEKTPKLRLHLRIPPQDKLEPERGYDWLVMQVDEVVLVNPIKFLEWFDVKIVVFGSNVDVYLNKQHAAHYFIPDPIRWENVIETKNKDKINKKKYIASMNYSSGKIGFRCSRSNKEHAHFRTVKVKPL